MALRTGAALQRWKLPGGFGHDSESSYGLGCGPGRLVGLTAMVARGLLLKTFWLSLSTVYALL